MKQLILSVVLSFLFSAVFAQCREYIKAIAPSQLEPYVLDGNFVAPVIYEGDQVTLNRTFLEGEQYKIMVLGFDLLQKYIIIREKDGPILFRNYPAKRKAQLDCQFTDYQGNKIPCLGMNYFEFKPDHTTTLQIIVRVERKARRKKDRLRGCLGIVVGFLPENTQAQDTTLNQ